MITPLPSGSVFSTTFIKFNKPQDRLFAGQIDRMSFTLRYRALISQRQRRRSPTRGSMVVRVSLIPQALYRPGVGPATPARTAGG